MSPSEVWKQAGLIQGMFIPRARQLEVVRQRNIERNWGFTDEDFADLVRVMHETDWPQGKLLAIVLEVSLDTVQQTFDEAWECAASIQRWSCRWNDLKSDADHLRLLPGIAHQRGLRWRVVDLAANWERKDGIAQTDVANPRTSPHSAILWAASYFPKWIQAMDGTTVPYVWIPGYQVTSANCVPWTNIPDISLNESRRELVLQACGGRILRNLWAWPLFRE